MPRFENEAYIQDEVAGGTRPAESWNIWPL